MGVKDKYFLKDEVHLDKLSMKNQFDKQFSNGDIKVEMIFRVKQAFLGKEMGMEAVKQFVILKIYEPYDEWSYQAYKVREMNVKAEEAAYVPVRFESEQGFIGDGNPKVGRQTEYGIIGGHNDIFGLNEEEN